jgi:hypothetical protein
MKQHEMAIMNSEGDTKCFWDPGNPESVSVASDTFATYSGRGYRAFAMSSGTQGEIMDGFDPGVGSILFVPPMQGG